MKIVNGASLQPRSGGKPKQIILLLHGFGSNGQDMITLAPTWQQALPDALFLAPHAPQRSIAGVGYQWWALSDISPRALALGAVSAAPAIETFIDRKLDQYGLADADLAIVGFSQGTMMALHVGLRRKQRVAAIVGYSGMLTGSAELRDEIQSRPRVLLVHGSHDAIIPVAALRTAQAELNHLEVEVTTHISNGIEHTVEPVGLRLGCEFVTASFGL